MLNGGWDWLGKQAKEKRKQNVAMQAQAIEQQRQQAEAKREAEALDALRREIQGILGRVNSESVQANRAIVHARELAILPALAGDAVLDQVDEELAALEVAIVQVEAGTVAAMASFDAHKLAVSRADARGAMTAVRGVHSRAKNVEDILEGRLEQLRLEGIWAQQAAADQEAARARAQAKAVEAAADQKRDAARRRLLDTLKAIQEVDAEIFRLSRALKEAREELSDTRARVIV